MGGISLYGNENASAKLRLNALIVLGNLAGMICVSKVIKLDIHSCDNFDRNPSNNTILPCLYDFEGVARCKKADVLHSVMERIGAPVKVRTCFDHWLDFHDLAGKPFLQFVLNVLSFARSY